MEFKNLAEVTKLEEVPEGASVLAATADGEVVRVPGDGLGGGGELVVFKIEDEGVSEITGSCSASFDECLEAVAKRGLFAFSVEVHTPFMLKIMPVTSIVPSTQSGSVTDLAFAEMLELETGDGFMLTINRSGAVQVTG